MLRAAFAVCLAGLLAAPAIAQEKFTIKIRKDAKGDVLKVTETETEKGSMKITVNNMVMPKDEDKGHSAAYTEKIVEKEDGKRATKVERTYTRAEMTKDGNKITPSFVGKTVLIERVGGGYKFSIDGKELSGDDAAFFTEEFKDKKREDEEDIEKLFLPKEAVAVNSTWKPDAAAVVKELMKDAESPLDIDAAKATASGKLLKAYKQGGKQYGVVEITVNLPLKAIGAGAMKIEMEAGSNIKLTFGFDGCIDGSASAGKMAMNMQMKMVGTLKTPDGVEVKLDGNLTKSGTKTQEPAK